MAFGIFAAARKEGKDVVTIATDTELLKDVGDSAIRRISVLRQRRSTTKQVLMSPIEEAIELAKRLEDCFANLPGEAVIIQPRFRGCGVLDSCYGDLLASQCLYEVKMVDRNLRGMDLRQVLVYCALNYRSQQYIINSVSILNPAPSDRIQIRY